MMILLHIGAHETAGALIRARLEAERDAVQREKIRFLTAGYVRASVSSRLDAASDSDRTDCAAAKSDLAKTLASILKTHAASERLILSDETMAGALLGAAGLYPDIAKRIAAVRDAAPRQHELRVSFGVRDYAGFFSSLFVSRSEEVRPHSLDAIRERALVFDRGWREVVADICGVVSPDRTTVWTYDAFLEDPEAVGGVLLGQPMASIFADAEGAAASLNAKAVEVLKRASDLLSAEDYARLSEALSHYAFEQPDQPFSAFDQRETEELKRRYEADLADIVRIGCGVITARRDAPRADAPPPPFA